MKGTHHRIVVKYFQQNIRGIFSQLIVMAVYGNVFKDQHLIPGRVQFLENNFGRCASRTKGKLDIWI